MSAEFEKRVHTNHNLKREELDSLKMAHSTEIEQLNNKHTQELTSLYIESMEANKFMEKLEHKIQGLEQDKETLEKTIEEKKVGVVILEFLKEEATNVNEELK
jgi:hypothetical protein